MSEARNVSFEEFNDRLKCCVDESKRHPGIFANVDDITEEEIWRCIDNLDRIPHGVLYNPKDDKQRDDKLFHCDEDYESYFVASKYGNNRKLVKDFLKKKCADKTICHFNHQKVYELIKKELGLQIPD